MPIHALFAYFLLVLLQGEKEKPQTSEASSEEASSSAAATSTAAAADAAAAVSSVTSASQFPAFSNPLLFPRSPFDPQMMMNGAPSSTSAAVPPISYPSPFMLPFMPMHHPAYAGRMPFMPPLMMPFYGQMPPPFLPPPSLGMPPYAAGPPGMFPFMPPGSMASLSTVASNVVTPTSVVWAGVSHPLPSSTIQPTISVSDVHRSSVNSQQPLSTFASSPAVSLSTSLAFTSAAPSQTTVPAAAAAAHASGAETAPVSASSTDISATAARPAASHAGRTHSILAAPCCTSSSSSSEQFVLCHLQI